MDGKEISVERKEVGKRPVTMLQWDKFPIYPTAITGAVKRDGRSEITLFTEELTGEGHYWQTQGHATGPIKGARPVAGDKVIPCMEHSSIYQGVLGSPRQGGFGPLICCPAVAPLDQRSVQSTRTRRVVCSARSTCRRRTRSGGPPYGQLLRRPEASASHPTQTSRLRR